jgi:hypothetical protein
MATAATKNKRGAKEPVVVLKELPRGYLTLNEPSEKEKAEEVKALSDTNSIFWLRRHKIDLPKEFMNRAFVRKGEVRMHTFVL